MPMQDYMLKMIFSPLFVHRNVWDLGKAIKNMSKFYFIILHKRQNWKNTLLKENEAHLLPNSHLYIYKMLIYNIFIHILIFVVVLLLV